jgi:2,5-diketo-D-gluconate reductase A
LRTPTAPTLALADGTRIPQVGLGTWPMDDATVERVVSTAVEAGYRHFDTAENYENERGVGRGLRAVGVPREQLSGQRRKLVGGQPARGCAGSASGAGRCWSSRSRRSARSVVVNFHLNGVAVWL